MLGGRPFITSHRGAATSSELSVLAIDPNHEGLTQVFAVSGWYPRPGDRWAYPMGDAHLLLAVGNGKASGRIVALDTQLALESVVQARASQ